MRLKRLTLEDWRPFEGVQEIELARDPNKNVTVVFGGNGSGKTTLLNACTWALYNSLTPDLERPDVLLNESRAERLAPGEEASARVTLEFEDQNTDYTLERHSTYRKQDDGSTTLVADAEPRLVLIDGAGRSVRRENPGDSVDRLLPQRLHHFFFFNGERIEQLVQPSAYEDIEQAIKTMLGLEVIERSLRHLPQVKKDLEKMLRDVGSDETRELSTALERLDEQRADAQRRLEENRRNIASLEEELESYDQKLRALSSVRELQQERSQLEREFEESKSREASLAASGDEIVCDRGFLAFIPGLLAASGERFQGLRSRGEIPRPIKRQFVDDLLESGECICGTALTKGTPEFERVSQWQSSAGRGDVENAWQSLYASCGHLQRQLQALPGELKGYFRGVAQERIYRERVEERLSEISGQLERFPNEDVQGLESERIRLARERDSQNREFGRAEDQIANLDAQIETKKKELKRAQARDEKEEVAKRRVETVEEVIGVLDGVYDLRTQDVREELAGRIKEVYASISFKPYEPYLTEDFQLSLLDQSSGGSPVAKSTGENQILSLAFVGALASMARSRAEEAAAGGGDLTDLFGMRGGVYPIVMDAAFGNLDDTYRSAVAKGLPALTDQVVVLVSKAQGQGTVIEELGNRVGRAYSLHYKTSKPGVASESLEVFGGSYAYVSPTETGMDGADVVRIL